jgi:hypothetical protein
MFLHQRMFDFRLWEGLKEGRVGVLVERVHHLEEQLSLEEEAEEKQDLAEMDAMRIADGDDLLIHVVNGEKT